MYLSRFISFVVTIILSFSCATSTIDKTATKERYDNSADNHLYIHQKLFQNRIDEEIPSKQPFNRIQQW